MLYGGYGDPYIICVAHTGWVIIRKTLYLASCPHYGPGAVPLVGVPLSCGDRDFFDKKVDRGLSWEYMPTKCSRGDAASKRCSQNRRNHPQHLAFEPDCHPYLDPKSMQNNSPKPLKRAQKAIILHTFGVQVFTTILAAPRHS